MQAVVSGTVRMLPVGLLIFSISPDAGLRLQPTLPDRAALRREVTNPGGAPFPVANASPSWQSCATLRRGEFALHQVDKHLIGE
jgi:hypothetical protein